MSQSSRKLRFSLAINEALIQMMEQDPSVIVIGQGVKSPWYVGNTCQGLIERFGEARVIDTPVSENAVTGVAVGASLAGMRAVVVHPRADFVFYAFDPIINQAANWHYMSGGKASAPVVFWLIVNRGGSQAAQHSQALHALFAHIPGLYVVAPSTPSDAKGLMIAAIRNDNPVVFIDDRWLYGMEEDVPQEVFEVPLGRAVVRRPGKDVTLVSFSWMAEESMKAVQELVETGLDVEFIDLRSVKPLDMDTILASVKKTGRLVIAEGAWKFNSVAAEMGTRLVEEGLSFLKSPVQRVCLPDAPAPASQSLEEAYYPGSKDIVRAIQQVCKIATKP